MSSDSALSVSTNNARRFLREASVLGWEHKNVCLVMTSKQVKALPLSYHKMNWVHTGRISHAILGVDEELKAFHLTEVATTRPIRDMASDIQSYMTVFVGTVVKGDHFQFTGPFLVPIDMDPDVASCFAESMGSQPSVFVNSTNNVCKNWTRLLMGVPLTDDELWTNLDRVLVKCDVDDDDDDNVNVRKNFICYLEEAALEARVIARQKKEDAAIKSRQAVKRASRKKRKKKTQRSSFLPVSNRTTRGLSTMRHRCAQASGSVSRISSLIGKKVTEEKRPIPVDTTTTAVAVTSLSRTERAKRKKRARRLRMAPVVRKAKIDSDFTDQRDGSPDRFFEHDESKQKEKVEDTVQKKIEETEEVEEVEEVEETEEVEEVESKQEDVSSREVSSEDELYKTGVLTILFNTTWKDDVASSQILSRCKIIADVVRTDASNILCGQKTQTVFGEQGVPDGSIIMIYRFAMRGWIPNPGGGSDEQVLDPLWNTGVYTTLLRLAVSMDLVPLPELKHLAHALIGLWRVNLDANPDESGSGSTTTTVLMERPSIVSSVSSTL
jgi:hypothetical protein